MWTSTAVLRRFCTIAAACLCLLLASRSAEAQFVSGTIFGTGLGSSPGGRDSNWKVVAVPSTFTPPSGQTVPYSAYIPTNTVPQFTGGGSPQTGLVYLGGTNYWIAPQSVTSSIAAPTYNWIAQQQFYVPVAGFYRFDFPGAGDNEMEFYIDGSINTTAPQRPTITGGQQIGGRAGTFTAITTFTGGAQLSSGTHTASMVLWDYGGETGALIGSSTFAPAVAYWAPGSGAGGNGTWNNDNAYWTTDAAGLTTKQPWTNGVGVAYFGGTPGTVSVSGTVNVNQMYFTTSGYTLQGGSGNSIQYGNGGTITVYSGSATIAAPQSFSNGLKISGNGTTILSGTTYLNGAQTVLVDSSNLMVNGRVESGGAAGTVYVSNGSLGGSGSIYSKIAGTGMVNPGLSGTASGILTAEQFIANEGMDLTFVFSGTVPNYFDTANSTNDVLRLTGSPIFTPPIPTALTSANTKTLFLNFTRDELLLGTGSVTSLKGGFFTDANIDFASRLNNETWDNAGFEVYVLGDGLGTDNRINGQGYYNWRNPTMFGWTQSLFMSTVAETANFSGGNVNGRVMLLTVAVPEPSTLFMLGGAGLALAFWKRRRRS
jgi:hypothetical protein